jgi:hypothetical protein
MPEEYTCRSVEKIDEPRNRPTQMCLINFFTEGAKSIKWKISHFYKMVWKNIEPQCNKPINKLYLNLKT